MKKYFLKDKKAIAFFNEKADSKFWDEHWKVSDLKGFITKHKKDDIFIPQVRKFLPRGATVLEGGCGRGQLVNALKYQGYNPIGIDFAKNTVNAIKESVPELDVRLGDVRALELDDGSVDGYISAGVIEHFWYGYGDITNEMYRVIKPNGYIFLTFPSMSFLRKLKANLGLYESSNKNELNEKEGDFYQFVLSSEEVVYELETLGFKLIKSKKIGGLKGLKDEVRLLKRLLQMIYDSKYLYPLHFILNKLLSPFSNHMTLLVARKI